MGHYQEVKTTDGLYFINQELIDRIIHNSTYFKSINNTEPTVVDNGWWLPETYEWKIDFDKANALANTAPKIYRSRNKVRQLLNDRINQSCSIPEASDIERMREELFEIEKEGRDANENYKKSRDSSSRKVMQNIDKEVGKLKTATEIAKFTRDASAEILLVSGAIVTGGSSSLLIGAAGSLLKGAAKYQDTGNLGAGVLQAGTSFVTFIIPGPGGKGMSQNSQRLLVIGKAKTEFTGNLMVGMAEGKSLKEASFSAAVDVGLGAAVKGVNAKLIPEADMKSLLKAGLKNSSIPVGLGLMNATMDKAKGRLNNALTKTMISKAKIGNQVQGLKNVAVASPILVDLAILGPDRCIPNRYW